MRRIRTLALLLALCAVVLVLVLVLGPKSLPPGVNAPQRELPHPPAKLVEGMVFIPAGATTVGTSEAQKLALQRETGVHPTWFNDELVHGRREVPAFWIDQHPVTNARYREFVQANAYTMPSTWIGTADARVRGEFEGAFPMMHAQHPVTGVSHDDAAAYARWAGKRLPTAEEWERAARGDRAQIYPWGNRWSDAAAPLWGDSESFDVLGTRPVGVVPEGASVFGVLDLATSVSQWTSSSGPHQGPFQSVLLKGGSWLHTQQYNQRGASTIAAPRGFREVYTGFRCALDGDRQPPATSATNPKVTIPVAASGARPAWAMPVPAGDQIVLLADRERRAARIALPHMPDVFAAVFAPESVEIDGRTLIESSEARDLAPGADVGPEPRVELELALQGLKLDLSLEADKDRVRYTYRATNARAKDIEVLPHTCLTLRSARFIDPDSTRTYMLKDGRSWVPLRTLQRGGTVPRWLTGPKTQEPGDSCLVAVVSRDGKQVIGHGRPTCPGKGFVASNPSLTCIHAECPHTVPAGQSVTTTGVLYFLDGGFNDLLARYRADASAAAPRSPR